MPGLTISSHLKLKAYTKKLAIFQCTSTLKKNFINDKDLTTLSSILVTNKDTDFLGLYKFLFQYFEDVSKNNGIEGTFSQVIKEREGTLDSQNNTYFQFIKVRFDNADLEVPISQEQVNNANKEIYRLFTHGFKFEIDNIILETIKKNCCVWKINKTSLYLKDSPIINNNVKIETSKDFDAFGLSAFIKRVKIPDYFEYLKMKELSIHADKTLSVIKEDGGFSLCKIDEEHINKYTETEKTLFTFLGILSGQVNVKKAENQDNS